MQQKWYSQLLMLFDNPRRNIIGAAKKQKSASAFDYLEKIPIEQWCNMQWITTWKLPPQQQLPPQYGVVTSNTSECINSIIDDYKNDGWTDLLEGIL